MPGAPNIIIMTDQQRAHFAAMTQFPSGGHRRGSAKVRQVWEDIDALGNMFVWQVLESF